MQKQQEFTIEQIEATMTYYGLIYMIDAIKKLRENDKICVDKQFARRRISNYR